jgi:hypothetical protein
MRRFPTLAVLAWAALLAGPSAAEQLQGRAPRVTLGLGAGVGIAGMTVSGWSENRTSPEVSLRCDVGQRRRWTLAVEVQPMQVANPAGLDESFHAWNASVGLTFGSEEAT